MASSTPSRVEQKQDGRAYPVLCVPTGVAAPQTEQHDGIRLVVDTDAEYDNWWCCGECGVIGIGTDGRRIERVQLVGMPDGQLRSQWNHVHVTCDACLALRTTLWMDHEVAPLMGELITTTAGILISGTSDTDPFTTIDTDKVVATVHALYGVYENRINNPRAPVKLAKRTGRAKSLFEIMQENARVAEIYAVGDMAKIAWWTETPWSASFRGTNLPTILDDWCKSHWMAPLCHPDG